MENQKSGLNLPQQVGHTEYQVNAVAETVSGHAILEIRMVGY